MNLNWESTVKLVQIFAENARMSVVFEEGEQPRTDGRTIFVPRPNPAWSKEDWVKWLGTTYHEIRHNWPQFRVAFEFLRDLNKKDRIPTKLALFINNILEDYRIEYNLHDKYAGEREAIADMRVLLADKSKQHLGQFDIQAQVAEAQFTFDLFLREKWTPRLGGLGKQWLNLLRGDAVDYVNKLHSGGYDQRLNVPFLSPEDQWKIVEDIFENVFKMDPYLSEEESNSAKSEGILTSPTDSVVPWEHLKVHDHGVSGTSYTSMTINYTNYKEGEFTPTVPPVAPRDLSKPSTPNKTDGINGSGYYNTILSATSTQNNLSKSVMRLLQIYSKKKTLYGQKRGKLSNRSLSRIVHSASASPRIFKQLEEKRTLDACVSILVDCSGSMGGDRYINAATSAIMLAETIGVLGVPLEVLGYTYVNKPIHNIIKPFGKKMSRERLAAGFSKASTEMGCNSDGESLNWAFTRISTQKQKKKVLIIISDGYPSASGGDALSYTKKIAKSIEKSNVDLYAIGVETDSVSKIYSRYSVLKNSDEIESTVLNLVKSKLIHN